jgi:hypothetical protein
MTTIQPEGEDLRKAVTWISEERQHGRPRRPLSALIETACVKFDLSPKDCEYLVRFFSAS